MTEVEVCIDTSLPKLLSEVTSVKCKGQRARGARLFLVTAAAGILGLSPGHRGVDDVHLVHVSVAVVCVWKVRSCLVCVFLILFSLSTPGGVPELTIVSVSLTCR